MAIQLRLETGVIRKLPSAVRFVEICDKDGALGAVVFADDRGAVHVHEAGSPDFMTYCKLFGIDSVSKVVDASRFIVPT